MAEICGLEMELSVLRTILGCKAVIKHNLSFVILFIQDIYKLGSERSADFPIHSCIILSLKLPPGNEIIHHAGHDHGVRLQWVHLIQQGGVLTHPLK